MLSIKAKFESTSKTQISICTNNPSSPSLPVLRSEIAEIPNQVKFRHSFCSLSRHNLQSASAPPKIYLASEPQSLWTIFTSWPFLDQIQTAPCEARPDQPRSSPSKDGRQANSPKRKTKAWNLSSSSSRKNPVAKFSHLDALVAPCYLSPFTRPTKIDSTT